MIRAISLVAMLALTSCGEPEEELRPVLTGAPVAGAAEGTLDLPVGTPLSGYTARCACLGSWSKQDDRDSAYTTTFVESTGVHIRPRIKTFWLENGDDHLVMFKTDLIYSWDGLVNRLTERLEEETGLDLEGRITHSANHNHSSYGTYSDSIPFYLGSDKFNRENFENLVEQHVALAMEAFEEREPVKIGSGQSADWDPDHNVYRDRRGENNELVIWDDQPEWLGGKDPNLNIVRVDTLDDRPLAMLVAFGLHPYALDDSKSLVSADATALIEQHVAESFDEEVMVMHLQTSGGDTSVAGHGDDFAKMESVGFWARDGIMALYDQIETSADPIRMETVSRHIDISRDNLRVTRDGTVDWYYKPFEEGYDPDDEVYGPDGELLSPIDEFQTEHGAVFCGSGDLDLPIGNIATSAEQYRYCLEYELLNTMIKAFFRLSDEDVALPNPGITEAGTAISRIGPMPTVYADGTRSTDDLLMGFFPGENTTFYSEGFRRSAMKKLGIRNAIPIGYSQDHEGYNLLVEDWLAGGYEPDISLFGPLQSEHVLEHVLAVAEVDLVSDVYEGHDDAYPKSVYPVREFPNIEPDVTPNAGRFLTDLPEYFWEPFLGVPDLVVPETLPRVQGLIELAWEGGDPAVDPTNVTLETLVDGEWVPATSRSGRPITEDDHDIIIGHTPDPLYPADASQVHYYWATWQAVGHVMDTLGLPLGTYRLKVDGQRYTGGNTAWPWSNVETYEIATEPFDLVPGTISLAETEGGLQAWYQVGRRHFRMIDVWGDSTTIEDRTGENAVRGEITVDIERSTGNESVVITAEDGRFLRTELPLDLANALSVTVTDAYGNTGSWTPDL